MVGVEFMLNLKDLINHKLYTLYIIYIIVNQECTVISMTKMVCPTPHIDLPEQFANLNLETPLRKRREIIQEVISQLTHHERVKRAEQTQISEHDISDER